MHIPMMLFRGPVLHRMRRLHGLGGICARLSPALPSLLKRSSIPLTKEEYGLGAFLSGLTYAFLFGGMFFVLSNTVEPDLLRALGFGLGAGLGLGFLFFIIILQFPRSLVRKKADLVDRYLIYALKDFLMQITAGHSVYNASVEISSSGYGQVSLEFNEAARKIQTGTSVETAFEEMARNNDSKHFKKVIWQIINTIRAGASLKDALESILSDLQDAQRSKIVNFANELNLWSLIYMLFAVAIPSIGTTMMVILSAFGGAGLTQASFVLFISLCGAVQLAIIGFIKARRPVVE